jgi:NIPSNAP protein
MLAEALTSIKRLGWDGRKSLEVPVAVTVFIRYQLDPFKRAMFEQYAKRWLTIIPKCGGDLVGYWMPHEGTNNIAFALISFENLTAYETYRARLRNDAEGVANFNFAEEHKFILVEERTFLRQVVSESGAK